MSKKKDEEPVIKNIAIVTGYGILFMYLIVNIILSQDMPNVYYDLVGGKDKALIEFMKQGRNLSVFKYMLPQIHDTYVAHEAEIYREDIVRRETINKLEALLVQNPKSTDVLYSLYLLYKKDGDMTQAEAYLKEAQSIDPKVGR